MPDLKSREVRFESTATVLKFEHFCSLRDTPIHSVIYKSTSDDGENMSE